MSSRLPKLLVVILWAGIVLWAFGVAVRIPDPPSWWIVLGAFGAGGETILLIEHYWAGRRFKP